MRFGKGLLIASLCAVPMIASAGFTPRDTFQIHSDVVSNNDPVNVPEPGTLALLLALASVVALDVGFLLQQHAVSGAPRLSLRRPLEAACRDTCSRRR